MTPSSRLSHFTEKNFPALWRSVYPVAYGDTEKWFSPKVAATMHANSVVSYVSGAGGESAKMHYAVASAIPSPPPVYFVTTELLQAAARTSLPSGVEWSSLNFPFPAMTFVFPRSGVLRHPTDGAVACATFATLPKGSKLSHSFTPNVTLETSYGYTTVMGVTEAMAVYHASCRWDTQPTTDSCSAEAIPEHREERLDAYGALTVLPLGEGEHEWIADFMRVVVSLALLVSARPDLAQLLPGKTRTPSKGSTAIPIVRPCVLGLNYAVQGGGISSGAPTGTHASPRLHWRRGHYRSQPFGQNRSQTKIIWIEPILVGGKVA